MVLTAQGRSLEDGALGSTIRVMNTKSNTIITAGTLAGVYLVPVRLYCFWMALAVGGLMVATGTYLHVKYR